MDGSNNFFTDTKEEIENYLENRALLLKMQTAGKLSSIIAKLVILVILCLLCFCMLFFLSIVGGYYFANLTGSLFTGYGIIVLIYLLFFVIVYLKRQKLVSSIRNQIIKVLFNKDE